MSAAEDFPSLPEREQRLIDDLVRHWLITPAIFGARHCPDLSEDGVRKLLARLVERGWLARHQRTNPTSSSGTGP